MTIDLKRRLARRAALAVAGTAVAATALTCAPAPAEADPMSELMGVAGQILQELPGTPNLSADLPSLFTLLLPDAAPQLPPSGDRRTSCRQVIHIGDSTSVGIDDPAKFPDAADRLSAQYERVGAARTVLNATGGRSIVERVNGEPNALDAVTTERTRNPQGCWVIAMGVNDAANVGVGSTVSADERIDAIMAAVDGQSVLWPTVATRNPSVRGYDAANMDRFNAALARAATRHRNLRVYDFAADAQPSWFTDDGIHFNQSGTTQRNRLFATALATAFPAAAGTPRGVAR
ncbi:SGNH/GDSL hydrolase family protein [Gordonia alkaliphila]|uniref:SGNH/GDSL hydrolase family protein n=1 Tax=Gordonia alkaliphila TaxID=1053547 RepID=UPI001FF2F8A8|nr:SGNH/GDSL hydrolase family protein [Gordonia alkaliphila]MCK0437882.1 SGNH/GDSL hydrolase family protein [Gordonia alkaliphila]